MRARTWLPWAALAVVVVAALAAGTAGGGPPTPAQRASTIASDVRCPQCAGQSAELSDAPAARAVRLFIADQIRAGRTNAEIEQELEDNYGSDILLRPPASGVGALVWALPVVAFVVAVAALAAGFRRWRPTGTKVSDPDRRRVAEALDEARRP